MIGTAALSAQAPLWSYFYFFHDFQHGTVAASDENPQWARNYIGEIFQQAQHGVLREYL